MMFMISYVPATEDPAAVERFNAAVKLIGNWSNTLSQQHVWFVASRLNANQLRDQLKAFINADKGDRLFVARIAQNWAGTNMGANFPDWLKRQEFGQFNNPVKSES